MDNILEVTGLVKRYPSFSLDNISFSLPEGCVTGFIGANGAGKTTTIRSILGLARKNAGVVKVFGLDADAHEQEIKDRIGIVMDSSYFYNDLSMKDMKSIIAPAYSKWSDADYRLYMEKFELDPKQKISTLSRGMRMKFALVLALSHQAELLIMDEPTSGLDPLIQREFYSILSERNAEGATVFLSCHVLSEVQRYCREAAVIRDGRLLVSSSVESLAHTGAKRVALRGVTALPSLADIRDITMSEDSISFLYGGAPSELLRALAPLPITDITISEPDMEEVFMHYYEGGVTNDNN